MWFPKFFTFVSPPVTLIMSSRSPKSDQLIKLFLMIYASLEKTQPLVQRVSYNLTMTLKRGTGPQELNECDISKQV